MWTKMYIGLKLFRHIFEKWWNIKFHENPSSTFCSYRGDKRAKPGNLPKEAALSRKFSCTKTSLGYYHKCTLYIDLHVKYLLFVLDFNVTWIFSTDFPKMCKYQISWKSVQWEPSCSLRTDRRTDKHDEADSRFSKLCESVLKKFKFLPITCHEVQWGSRGIALLFF